MRCKNCGFENDRHAKHCGRCDEKFSGKSKGLFILAASLFVIMIAIIVVYLTTDVFNGSNDDEVDVFDSTSDLFAAAGPGSDIHGAIHRIEYGDNVVYLFGTMHAATSDWFPLADVVEEAMRRADVFAFESDLTFESVELDELLALRTFYEEDRFLPDDQTLADVLPADIHESLVEHIESFGRTYEDVSRMNPIALAVELQVEVMAEIFADAGIYYDGQLGVDGYILDFAMRHDVPIIGLEPVLQQMRIGFAPNEEILNRAGFDGSLADLMYDAFIEFISRDELLEILKEEEVVIYTDYLHNDLETMIQGMKVTDEELENEFMRYMVEVLMNFRSTYYAERIAELLRDTEEPTTFFVAVGISHVIRTGDHLTNIVEQLALLGITAEPIFE